ncbi:MAG: alpha/beta hydrolase [Acidimicrobiaceae bacterium]|nr:alpha/beta hydrolase [Acidimicrobiaceae bacterium]
MTGAMISAEAAGMAYDEAGQGPAVVFSHGSMMDRTMFEPQLEALSDHYRVVAFDHRARGARWEGPYSLYDLADDCVRLLDSLQIERCVIAGMSMGGWMALRVVLRHRDRINGLALIASSGLSYSEADQSSWEQHYRPLLGAPQVGREFALGEARLCFSASTRANRPEMVRHWVERWASHRGDAVYHEVCSWLMQDDISEHLDTINVPAVAIHGLEDEAIGIEDARTTVAAIGSAYLVPIPGAGHTVNLESPDQVNAALRAFLVEVYGEPVAG